MSNLLNPAVKPLPSYLNGGHGRPLSEDEVPACWPVHNDPRLGKYAYWACSLAQHKRVLQSDVPNTEGTYISVSPFTEGSPSRIAAFSHFCAMVVLDFDIIDYMRAQHTALITPSVELKAQWDAEPRVMVRGKGTNAVLKDVTTPKDMYSKRVMYALRRDQPEVFEGIFAEFKQKVELACADAFVAPTHMVMSGGGIHCYWHLDTASCRAQTEGALSKDAVVELNANLVKVVNAYTANNAGPTADPKVADPLARVMAFPGGQNRKDPKLAVDVVPYAIGDGSSGVMYSFEALVAALGEAPAAAADQGSAPAPNNVLGMDGKPVVQQPNIVNNNSGTKQSQLWDFATLRVTTEDGEYNLAELVDSLPIPSKVECVCPFGGSSIGGAIILKTMGRRACLSSNAKNTDFIDNRGFISNGALAQYPSGGIKPSEGNIEQILFRDKRLGFTFLGFDTFSKRVFFNGEPMKDHDITRVMTTLSQVYGIDVAFTKMRGQLYSAAHRNEYDSLVDFLNALPAWDGTERLNQTIGRSFAEMRDQSWAAIVSRRMMLSFVARGFSPSLEVKVDTMPVLIGLQGAMKSRFWSILFFKNPRDPAKGQQFIGEGEFPMTSLDKDSVMKLQGVLAWEVAELAGMAKTEVESIKSFLSITSDKIRRPHGSEMEVWARRACMVGTDNRMSILKDDTGNRRFWPVALGASSLDEAWLYENLEQIWAEAIAAFKQGEQHWLTKDESAVAMGRTRQHSVSNLEAEAAQDWTEKKLLEWDVEKDGIPWTTASEYLQAAFRLSHDDVTSSKHGFKMAHLTNYGWIKGPRRTVNGVKTTVYEYTGTMPPRE